MGLLDIFRRPPPIRDAGELAEFIDQRAAFLTQKGIYEYSRARAGHYAKVLLREQTFQDAADHSRWRAYPLGLAMVAELVEGVLRRAAGSERHEQTETIRALVLSIFDRYPIPAGLSAAQWAELRTKLSHNLQLIGLHAPKAAMDVPVNFADAYFDLMPVHEKLRGPDYPAIRNYLRVTSCNIHDELTKRLDVPAVAASLRADKAVAAH